MRWLAAAATARRREQWSDPSKLADLRARRLRRLLKRAARAPYYRDLFRQIGIDPDDFAMEVRADECSLARLPLLDKATVRANRPEALLTEPAAKLFAVKSSGSTGKPTLYLRSPRDQAKVAADWLRLQSAYGRRPLDQQVNIASGRPIARSGPLVALRKIHLAPAVHQISSFDPMEEQIAPLRRLRPQVLSGYAIGLELLAEAILEAGVTDFRPRVVYSFGMELSDRARRLCMQAFGVPAHDVYGANEVGVIAWECPVNMGLLHVNDDTTYVEIVDDSGVPVAPGVPGRVIVTPLGMTAQPLLRYVVDDTSARVAERCSCGRGLGLMERVHGRTQHVIHLRGGQLLSPPLVSSIFAWIPQVVRYQIRETAPGVIQAAVIPAPGTTHEVVAAVEQAFRSRTPGLSHLEVTVCDSLPLAPSGKFQTIIPFNQDAEPLPDAAA